MSYKKLIPNIYLKDEKAYADKDLSVLLGNCLLYTSMCIRDREIDKSGLVGYNLTILL